MVGFSLFWQWAYPPPEPKPGEQIDGNKTDSGQQRADSLQSDAGPSHARTTAEEPSPADLQKSATGNSVTKAPDRRIKISSDIYEAVLSSTGARIVSFKLKKYKKTLESDDPVNLVPPGGPDSSGPSLMITRRDQTLYDDRLSFECGLKQDTVTLDEAGAKKVITFTTRTEGGLIIKKMFTFRADQYVVDFSFTLTNTSSEPADCLITVPWKKVYKGEQGDRFAWNSAEIYIDDQVRDYQFSDIEGDEEPSGNIRWAGLGDVYFFKALVFPDTPAKRITLFKPTDKGIAEIWARLGGYDLPPNKPVDVDLLMYFGPKEIKALNESGHDLRAALYYSSNIVLEVMSVYLMKFLRFCHNGFTVAGIRIPGTGNYGIDIIILTILIKILFVPLTHKSMKSMKRMQELQPHIQKLKEKYKDDKQAMNQATMELFKEHKVNPLGGCWPMLLQLPVFIALYQTLAYAIELRHASFVCIPQIYLCLNDLSAPDPYYVTPILMGGSMVLQQWMTPSAGDPMQRKMMLIMPVVFTYLFLSFPSGLVLYWLVSNLLSIGQQVITNKLAES